MAKERGRRRRGRRSGRREQPPSRPTEERQGETPATGDEDGVAEEGSTSQPTSGHSRQEETEAAGERVREPGRRGRSAERQVSGRVSSVSPLSFWRRGQARPHRAQRLPRRRSLWRRVTRFDFPPWVPVVAIIAVVFGILGLLFLTRAATGAPRIGDHWNATYQINICGERQPNLPEWGGGIHTHGGGGIHIEPEHPSEEGAGARLVRWFEYGGGKLTQSEMRVPGQRETWKNGDMCDDGAEGVLQVVVNGERKDNWSRYIPQDQDRIRIVFGPEEETAVAGEGSPSPLEETPTLEPSSTTPP